MLPVLRAIQAEPTLRLAVIVSGTHLAPEFGSTVRQIERDGFDIADRVEMLLASDTPLGVAKSMGLATLSFADCYARQPPDLLFATGDRFEMHAAVVAALPFAIPVAHLHGGEITAGAFDDALRHSMTKLSHLHFSSTTEAATRLVQLGEEPWRVTVSGAPSLDNIGTYTPLASDELERRVGMSLEPAPLLVTFHPVTLQYEHTAEYVDEMLAALADVDMPIVFTRPNADTSGRIVGERIGAYVAERSNASICDNLGTAAYFSLMRIAAAMVGNSSSGIIEAASFGLPVVNIGDRQAGRLQALNVINVCPERLAIGAAIRRASSNEFRSGLTGLVNPYGRGNAAAVIVERLRSIELDQKLLMKRFHDVPATEMQYA